MTTENAILIYKLDNAFWRFSIAVYQNETVKKACLSFQENQKANVNLLLLCCWLAYAVEEISQIELLEACHTIDNWHTFVTQRLRKTRYWIKSLANDDPWIDEFAQQITMNEIISETRQQHQLYTRFESKQKTQGSKNEALAVCYLNWLFDDMNFVIDKEIQAKLNNFVHIIFSMVTTHEKDSADNRD